MVSVRQELVAVGTARAIDERLLEVEVVNEG